MSQSQNTDYAIDPYTTSGVQLADILNRMHVADLTGHSGAARPPYARAGTIWLDSSVAPGKWMVFDGANDVPLLSSISQGVMTVDANGNVNFVHDLDSRGRHVAVNFDMLTLNIAPGGSANPADPIGNAAGSGDAFNSLGSLFIWIGDRANVKNLIVNVADGTYAEAGQIIISSGISSCSIRAPTSATFNFTAGYVLANTANLNVENITFSGSGNPTYGFLLNVVGSINLKNSAVTNANSGTDSVWVFGGLLLSSGLQITGSLRIFESGFLRLYSFQLTLNCSAANQIAAGIDGGLAILPGGRISTPGTAKKLRVAYAARSIERPTLENGAVFEFVAGSVATNGWMQDPVTGIITQWGVAANVPSGTLTDVNFPIAFPNTGFVVHFMSWGGNVTPIAGYIAPTKGTVIHMLGSPTSVAYIAIGN
jgi:hypothetical protein